MAKLNVTVLGNGAMATVCAAILESQPHNVTMWGPMPEQMEQMIQTRRNDKYLKGYPIPASVRLTCDIVRAMQGAELVVSAIPTQFIRAVWSVAGPMIEPGVPIVSVAKGIETETMLRPTQIIEEILGDMAAGRSMAALSGPSIAEELARCLPATVSVAGSDAQLLDKLQAMFTTSWFRVYTNTDLVGVELAGATKNVIALAAGILDGMSGGNNAKSALLARGLAEIARLGAAMGASRETFFGVAGVGDLATTCFSPSGRNRSAGELLGRGMTVDEVIAKIEGVVEGIPTTRAVVRLARKHGVEMPITQAVHEVLFNNMDPLAAISMLMSRQPKPERM